MPLDEITQLISVGRSVMDQQPFSRLLGAELSALEPGYAEIQLLFREDLRQHRGILHGGVLAYLADNVQTFAGGSILGEKVATLETKINYIRPVTSGLIVARANVIGGGRRTAVTKCEIFNRVAGNETIVAAAQGTIITLD